MPRFGTWMMGVIIGSFFAASALAAEIDINKADAALMAAEVGGLGIGRAEAIVRYREQHGAFTSVDQLVNVPGVSKRIVDNNRNNLTVGTMADKPASPQP